MIDVAKQVRGRPLPYLRAWRVSKYLTQDRLEELSGVSKASISRAESGTSVVGFNTILKLAGALHLTPDELTFTEPSEPMSGVYPVVGRAEQAEQAEPHSEGKEGQAKEGQAKEGRGNANE